MNKNEQKLSGFNGLYKESILLVFSESVASSEGDGTPSIPPSISVYIVRVYSLYLVRVWLAVKGRVPLVYYLVLVFI